MVEGLRAVAASNPGTVSCGNLPRIAQQHSTVAERAGGTRTGSGRVGSCNRPNLPCSVGSAGGTDLPGSFATSENGFPDRLIAVEVAWTPSTPRSLAEEILGQALLYR